MRVALVLIPESNGAATAADQLAAIASDAGWSLVVADDPDAAISRLREVVGLPVDNGAAASPDALHRAVDTERARAAMPGTAEPEAPEAIERTGAVVSGPGVEGAWSPDEPGQGRELLQVTLDSIGEGVVTTDVAARITFMNGVAEALCGWRLDEAIGQPLATIINLVDGASGRPIPNRTLLVIEHGAVVAHGDRIVLVARDGARVPIDGSCSPIRDDAGAIRGIVMVLRDVTERTRAEHELRAQGERLELLHEVGRALSAELDLRTLVQTVTDAATRLCGAAYGSFFVNARDETSDGFNLFALSGIPREAFAHMPMPRATEIFALTFEGIATLRIDDVTRDPRFGRNSPYYGLPSGHVPIRSYLSVPVVSRSGEVIGGLFFGHPEPGVFDALDERIVTSLAAQAAIAMDNARLYRAMQQEIEERRRAQEEMMNARDEAEAASRAKDQFLAVLSHELRTPLTPVLAVTHVLENDERIAADQRPLVEMIRRNIELEARLIDDLLDLTRISKGKISLSFETVDVHRIVNSVAAICRGDMTEKRIELYVDLQARDHFIRADSARMQQVLWNLVKNAIKFTPEEGRITIRTRNDRPGHLRIEVADTGIGIDPSLLPRIFNAFDQGTVDMRRYGGLGLGLSISRSLVEMHGGTLTAESDGPGLGSTFVLEIDTVVRLRVDGGLPVADGLRRAVRVLVVDDHIETSKVMKLLLERRGYVVEAAHTLHDALEATRTSDFDLLISDIGLPDGSGLELMRALADRSIRGIALSGFGMDEDIARSKEAGFVEHLIKPVSFQALQETIGRVLG